MEVKQSPSPVKLTAEQLREQEEAREIMEVSMIDDNDDLIPPSNINVEEKKPEKVVDAKTVSTQNGNKTQSVTQIRSITAKPSNTESTIFDELKDIDFSAEAFDDNIGNIDFNTVSYWNQLISNSLIKIKFHRNR